MTDSRYHIQRDDKFGALPLIDINADAAHESWFNQILTTVDESVIRVGIIEGEFHWHKHDDTDEFFLVLDGQLLIDIADSETITLERHQGLTVSKGPEHRTRASPHREPDGRPRERTANRRPLSRADRVAGRQRS